MSRPGLTSSKEWTEIRPRYLTDDARKWRTEAWRVRRKEEKMCFYTHAQRLPVRVRAAALHIMISLVHAACSTERTRPTGVTIQRVQASFALPVEASWTSSF